MNCEVFESEFFKDSTDADKNEVKVTQAINSSPVLIDMQKYIHRFVKGQQLIQQLTNQLKHNRKYYTWVVLEL